jgi:hypothetical protein
MKSTYYISVCILTIIVSVSAFSQNNSEGENILQKADSLHKSYKFKEAVSLYEQAVKMTADSSSILEIEEKITQCENGISFLKYATTPKVISNRSFNIADFYLNLSDFKNQSWMPIPNPLVSKDKHPYYSAIYFPENITKLFFSSPDNSGSWNIYETDYISNNLWSEPELLGEEITSSGDEIFPILSSDGKELYFASNGHYGMGGYDLYVSRLDESTGEWGMPENMGFPYSSTADDIFFMNTADGQYSFIASNRNSEKDSIKIYVIEYNPTPIKKEISDYDKILEAAKLLPIIKDTQSKQSNKIELSEEEGMSEYSKLVSQMRLYKIEMEKNIKKQQENRELYDKIENEDDKSFIKEMITDLENEAITLRAKYEGVSKNVQKAEMDFLAKGIIPQVKETHTPAEKNTQIAQNYNFTKNSFSEIKAVEIEKTIPKFDYSFKILDKAQFAEDNNLPSTLIYQIQILVTTKKVTVNSLKGLSPVFENKQASGKYLYTVGLFYSHSEALSCLNQVRKKGFPKAFIVAYNSGKSIAIKEAKVLEKKASSGGGIAFQVLLENFPDGISAPVISAIKESSDKDITKSSIEGKTVYIVGPFSHKTDAEYLFKILTDLGIEGVSIKQVK